MQTAPRKRGVRVALRLFFRVEDALNPTTQEYINLKSLKVKITFAEKTEASPINQGFPSGGSSRGAGDEGSIDCRQAVCKIQPLIRQRHSRWHLPPRGKAKYFAAYPANTFYIKPSSFKKQARQGAIAPLAEPRKQALLRMQRRMQSAGVVTYVKLLSSSNAVLRSLLNERTIPCAHYIAFMNLKRYPRPEYHRRVRCAL